MNSRPLPVCIRSRTTQYTVNIFVNGVLINI